MTNYSFFKKIIHSFYSKDVYLFVGKSEINKIGFKYLILLISLFWIPEIIKIQVSLTNFVNNELPPFVEKLPSINITNGVASFDKQSPYIVSDDATGKAIMIFDNTGEYTTLENTEAKVLVTSTKVVYKQSKYETREYSFKNVNQFSLSPAEILSYSKWVYLFVILLYFIIVPMAFVYRSFIALCYAVVGLLFQAILKTNYSFQTIYRLSILAFTPAYVIDKLFVYFDFKFTGWAFCCVVASLAFLFFALNVNKEEETFTAVE